ncbi:MAG: EMC3/TMCO1 family protein [Promethearchaeota archaeon]
MINLINFIIFNIGAMAQSNGWEHFLQVVQRPPGATVFILFLSLVIGLITAGLNRLLLDPKRMQQKQREIMAHQKERKEIDKYKETNPKKYHKMLEKWERKDKAIQKMQQKMSLERLKPTCITFLPMFIFFFLLRNFYTYNGIPLPVAITPMNANDVPWLGNIIAGYIDGVFGPEQGMINFTTWYFLCSFTFSTIIQKLMKITPVSGGGLGDIFNQSKYQSYKT